MHANICGKMPTFAVLLCLVFYHLALLYMTMHTVNSLDVSSVVTHNAAGFFLGTPNPT